MANPSYLLNVMSPKGGIVLRSFSNLPEGRGLQDGLAATVDPYSFCNELLFAGRRDLVQLGEGEVVQAFVNENGLKSVFYGAVTTGDTDEPTDKLSNYTASARALLIASACRGERYRNQDTSLIALDLVTKHRHPALKVKAADFPPSGTVLDSFIAIGQLGEVLDSLLELTENKAYGSGLDPDGFVFFRPNTLTRQAMLGESDYASLPLSGAAITTAMLWTFTAELSEYAGPYVPGVFTHLSIPDAAQHDKYGYERHREVPLSAFQSVADSSYTQVGFTNPQNAVTAGATTPATRTGTGTSTFTLQNADPAVYGLRLLYRLGDDAGVVKVRATAGNVYYERELQKSDSETEFKPVDIFLPPHAGTFSLWSTFKITAAAGGVFELLGFYPLRLDLGRLDALAPLVTPERRPGQIIQPGIRSNAATIVIPDATRGRQESPSAGLRWAWTVEKGAITVTDLETSAYSLDARTEKVSGYFRKPKS